MRKSEHQLAGQLTSETSACEDEQPKERGGGGGGEIAAEVGQDWLFLCSTPANQFKLEETNNRTLP